MTSRQKSLVTAKIRREARRLGFFKMGVARCGLLPRRDKYDRWLAEGMHGGMGYMQRQHARRCDPGSVLAEARTLLVLAMNYHTGGHLEAKPLQGRISCYAWGEDYHEVLRERLHRLECLILSELPDARTLAYVDTGPVMEKVWGAQTSLGWMGKHSNLISRDQGSWFFIGVILADVELEYDRQDADYCGTCTRCIAACPTGAIVAPYVVDARLCISYLTIEWRGKIPRPLRPGIGNRIFGCDDCQEVCPWNRFAQKTSEADFQASPGNFNPELVPLLYLTSAEFSRRFRRSPVLRVRRDGFIRNVVIALGNSGSCAAVQPLAHALSDESALVRAHAAWALQRLRTPEAGLVLDQRRPFESDPSVLEEFDSPA
jgi:epoxyqueuosine reductase